MQVICFHKTIALGHTDNEYTVVNTESRVVLYRGPSAKAAVAVYHHFIR